MYSWRNITLVFDKGHWEKIYKLKGYRKTRVSAPSEKGEKEQYWPANRSKTTMIWQNHTPFRVAKEIYRSISQNATSGLSKQLDTSSTNPCARRCRIITPPFTQHPSQTSVFCPSGKAPRITLISGPSYCHWYSSSKFHKSFTDEKSIFCVSRWNAIHFSTTLGTQSFIASRSGPACIPSGSWSVVSKCKTPRGSAKQSESVWQAGWVTNVFLHKASVEPTWGV